MSQVAQKQSPTTPGTVTQRLKSERVQEMLAAMPTWTLLPPEGEAISRVFQLPSSRVAAAFAEYVMLKLGPTADAPEWEVILPS